jgi:hypothetical protein
MNKLIENSGQFQGDVSNSYIYIHQAKNWITHIHPRRLRITDNMKLLIISFALVAFSMAMPTTVSPATFSQFIIDVSN